ncbi:hypothetical protein D9611_014723 [Ephemerocybe angulata]|uniref:HAT C-terminal dimerisation domain-containing protein n=1 Tax=Ephemerocybe angulata TaxID=980116 RepID=A0A8H5B996_9AGAR|nr:hypothetical protein D9611_014723 [Tulosesus angulatus]
MATHGWPEEWILKAKSIGRTIWQTQYRPAPPAEAETSTAASQDLSRGDRFKAARERFKAHGAQHGDGIEASDPYEEWISSPPVMTSSDPITYWTGMLAAGDLLAPMALDYLTAPATSTDVERAFSRGGLTVSKLRHSLADKTTKASTVLGSWHEHGGLIPFDDLVAKFKQKRKRGKKKARGLEEAPTELIELDS